MRQSERETFETEDILQCKVLGSSLVRSMRLMTTVTGQVFVFNVPGLKVKSPIPGSLLTLHKDGRTAIAPARVLSALSSKFR